MVPMFLGWKRVDKLPAKTTLAFATSFPHVARINIHKATFDNVFKQNFYTGLSISQRFHNIARQLKEDSHADGCTF
jgi:hypothetical protein